TVIEPREQGHRYWADHRGDELILMTDSPAKPGGPPAKNYRLVTARLDKPGRASWTEVVPHRDDVLIETFTPFATHVVPREVTGGVRRLRIFPGKKISLETSYLVPFEEAVYNLRSQPNMEVDATTYRFKYESPTAPEVIYDYDTKKRAL